MTIQQGANDRITSRPVANHNDFMRVRQLLIDTYPLYGTYQNWELRRWEGQWYWGRSQDIDDILNYARLWETASGEVVAAAHIEGSNLGNAWIESHPDYRHLEPEMIEYAETNLAKIRDDGKRSLDWYIYDDDTLRRDLLAKRGYIEQTERREVLRAGKLADLLAKMPDTLISPPGYTVRCLQKGDAVDTLNWMTVSGKVFGHDAETEPMVRFQTSPSFDAELHIIAEAPDGSFAAFAGLTVDPTNRAAIFEPVGTHPDHRRKRLASLVMWEGMRRLSARGDIDIAYLGTGDAIPANGLYDALGFTINRSIHRWNKVWA